MPVEQIDRAGADAPTAPDGTRLLDRRTSRSEDAVTVVIVRADRSFGGSIVMRASFVDGATGRATDPREVDCAVSLPGGGLVHPEVGRMGAGFYAATVVSPVPGRYVFSFSGSRGEQGVATGTFAV